MDPAALYLLGFIPLPNVQGTSNNGKNYHLSTTANSSSDSLSVRLTQNLSPTVQPNGRGGFQGRGGGGGGGRGGVGGRGGGCGTDINLHAPPPDPAKQSQGLYIFSKLRTRPTNTETKGPVTLYHL